MLLSWIPMPNLAIGWAVIPVENLGKVCIVACKIPTMAASLWLQNCKLLSKFKKKSFTSLLVLLLFLSRLHLFNFLFVSICFPSLHSPLHLNVFAISSISSQQKTYTKPKSLKSFFISISSPSLQSLLSKMMHKA